MILTSTTAPSSTGQEVDWQTIAQQKRAACYAKIPPEWILPVDQVLDKNASSTQSVLDIPSTCGILTPDEVAITTAPDATHLLSEIHSGRLSAAAVTLAFSKRAAIAHQLVNCLTETFFPAAAARAEELDAYFATHGRPVGPLHGLPISLKESYNVAGVPTSNGYIAFVERPAKTRNSALVQILHDLGAVLYVKTNVPQSFMTADSENNVFGRTLNPRRLCLTAGGSSGGEGALLALRGSILGVGTDVAGSIRIPALCNGVYGLKLTSGRIPFGGQEPPGRVGSPSPIAPCSGPMGVSIRDLELFARVVVGRNPWEMDETAAAVPWRSLSPSLSKPVERRLRLGVILEDPTLPLHPPVLRMMETAMRKLDKAGHVLVPIHLSDDDPAEGRQRLPTLTTIARLAWKFFALDPAKTVPKILAAGGEPLVKSLSTTRFSEDGSWEPTLDNLWDMNVARHEIRAAFKEMVVGDQLEGIIMPPFQATAVPHDTYGTVPYTTLANLLDWPAAVIPWGKADAATDKAFAREGLTYKPEYLPDLVEGMPCSLQMLGRPWKDEELLTNLSNVMNCLRE